MRNPSGILAIQAAKLVPVYPYLGLTKKDIEVREMEGVEPHGPSPFTMNTQLVERKSYRWHVPVVMNCSTAIEVEKPKPTLVRSLSGCWSRGLCERALDALRSDQ